MVVFENFTSLTVALNNSSPNDVCMINQYAVINSTAQLPILAFWFSVAIIAFLFIHWSIMPLFRKQDWFPYVQDTFLIFATISSIWVPLILMYFTFHLDSDAWNVIENNILYGVLVVFVVIGIFWARDRLRTKK